MFITQNQNGENPLISHTNCTDIKNDIQSGHSRTPLCHLTVLSILIPLGIFGCNFLIKKGFLILKEDGWIHDGCSKLKESLPSYPMAINS